MIDEPMKKEGHQSQIMIGVEQLEKSIESTLENITHLEGRLEKVLCVENTDAGVEEKGTHTSSPMAISINKLGERVFVIDRKITSILRRLDL